MTSNGDFPSRFKFESFLIQVWAFHDASSLLVCSVHSVKIWFWRAILGIFWNQYLTLTTRSYLSLASSHLPFGYPHCRGTFAHGARTRSDEGCCMACR